MSRLLAVIADPRDAAIFGLMVGEVSGLRVADLTAPPEPDGLARLRVLGKGRKERIVWLTPLTSGKVSHW